MLGKTWAKETLPPRYEHLRPSLRALTWASEALEFGPAFTDRRAAGRGDIAAIIDHCRRKTAATGAPFAGSYADDRLGGNIKAVLGYCRSAGHMDEIPGGHSRSPPRT